MVESTDGVVLRFNSAERTWDRVMGTAPLTRSDRILCLAPFQARLELGKTKLVLESDTEVRIVAPAAEVAPGLELVHGRIRIQQPAASALDIVLASRKISLAAADDSTLALERTPERVYGVVKPPVAPPLFIYCTRGEVNITVGKQQETLKPSDALALDATSPVQRSKQDAPAWASAAEPPAHELQIRDQFLHAFHVGRPVLTEVVAASEDESADTKRLSIQALKSLGELSLLMPILNRKDDPIARRRAITETRAYRSVGPAEASRVHDQLLEEFGPENAPIVEKLLVGFAPEETSNPKLFTLLVETLSPEQQAVGVRELALENLKRLTGRDDLGYNPDHPEEKDGLKAWQDLDAEGKLRAASPARAKTE